MDIQLKGLGNKLAVAQTKKNPSEKPAAAAGTKVGSGPGEAASLKLTSLTASLANVPVVEESRIERVSALMQAGHYQVDPQKVADKIIALEEKLP